MQLGDSLQDDIDVGTAPTIDVESTCTLRLAPQGESLVELRSAVDLCQGSSLSSPP